MRIFVTPAAVKSSMFARASSWNWYSLPVRLATSPVQRSFGEHAERHAARAQDVEQRPQRLLEVGLERPGAAEPHQVLVPAPRRRSRGRPTARTSAAGRRRGPRCCRAARGGCRRPPSASGASPFDTSPRRAPMMSGRCSMPTGHWFSHAPHVVHCHSTLRVEDVGQLRVELAGEQRVLVLQDERLRIQQLARARWPGSSPGSGRTRRT